MLSEQQKTDVRQHLEHLVKLAANGGGVSETLQRNLVDFAMTEIVATVENTLAGGTGESVQQSDNPVLSDLDALGWGE